MFSQTFFTNPVSAIWFGKSLLFCSQSKTIPGFLVRSLNMYRPGSGCPICFVKRGSHLLIMKAVGSSVNSSYSAALKNACSSVTGINRELNSGKFNPLPTYGLYHTHPIHNGIGLNGITPHFTRKDPVNIKL